MRVVKKIETRPYSFIKDVDKMRDFLKLDKWKFLKLYSYLVEEEYDATVWEYVKRTRNAYRRNFL